MDCSVKSFTVETSDGAQLQARIFGPREEEEEEVEEEVDEEQEDDDGEKGNDELVVILVHPYSILGGCQSLLGGIASRLARKGYKAVTFDMRGVRRSKGKPSLTGFKEINDVVAVCRWASQNLSTNRILLSCSALLFQAHKDQCFVQFMRDKRSERHQECHTHMSYPKFCISKEK